MIIMVASCCYFVLFIIIIIIAIIYTNENPMVCLLALWVYTFFSLPKDQQLYFV